MDAAIWISGLLSLAVLGVFFIWSLPLRRVASMEERFEELNAEVESGLYAGGGQSLASLEMDQPFYERIVRPILSGLSLYAQRMTPAASAEKLRQQLVLAGNPFKMHGSEFSAVRIVSAFALGGLLTMLGFALAMGTQGILMGAMGLVFGYIMPPFWLKGRIKRRQRAILKLLPEAIDLLVISVEAGMAFDTAMSRVSEKWDNPLAREFARALGEMKVGKNKADALRGISQRTGVNDVATFMAAIIQADQLGVPISKVLRIQSEQMRVRRRQRAEEQAHKAPILMMLPLVFLIFPATYIIILGPSVPKVMFAFGG